ncbi:hypothetical protein FQZ97_1268320 [compost metagenome]
MSSILAVIPVVEVLALIASRRFERSVVSLILAEIAAVPVPPVRLNDTLPATDRSVRTALVCASAFTPVVDSLALTAAATAAALLPLVAWPTAIPVA